jgi:hypothetical protein
MMESSLQFKIVPLQRYNFCEADYLSIRMNSPVFKKEMEILLYLTCVIFPDLEILRV